MDKQIRQQLLDRFSALPRKERARLTREATALRQKAAPKRRPSVLIEDEEEGTAARQKATAPLEPFLLEVIAREEPKGDEVGLIVGLALGRATVEIGGERLVMGLSSRLLTAVEEGGLTVGDQVTVADEMVRTVLKRRTWLGRTDPMTQQQRAIVANVDVIVVVVSVVAPPLHPRIIDRYLIGIGRGGATPLIAVNKVDFGGEELEQLDPYRAAGIEILPVSADTGLGIEELKERLRGKTCAFVGHSGVGKSSLVNAISPESGQRTGEVSEGYGRGTHTTTSSSMFDLGNGTRLIDTPGIRAFGLGPLTWTELSYGFPEFAEFPCRLRNCTHRHEPDCGVLQALENGELSEFRYDTYLTLLEDVKGLR